MSKEKKEKPKLPQSESIMIKRSQIDFNPQNVKRHRGDDIKKQLDNFKRVGYLGGIIVNKTTGKLISGHKRLSSLDLFYENKPDSPVDYELRVEMIAVDKKTELEQLIYMDARSTNTAQAYDLLVEILPEIDYKAAGLGTEEMNLIAIESPLINQAPKEEITDSYKDLGKSYEDKKAAIKEAKAKIKDEIHQDQGGTYVMLTFNSNENKCAFMERFGFKEDLRIIKGESFSDMVERVN
jgi:hypothetical protein